MYAAADITLKRADCRWRAFAYDASAFAVFSDAIFRAFAYAFRQHFLSAFAAAAISAAAASRQLLLPAAFIFAIFIARCCCRHILPRYAFAISLMPSAYCHALLCLISQITPFRLPLCLVMPALLFHVCFRPSRRRAAFALLSAVTASACHCWFCQRASRAFTPASCRFFFPDYFHAATFATPPRCSRPCRAPTRDGFSPDAAWPRPPAASAMLPREKETRTARRDR